MQSGAHLAFALCFFLVGLKNLGATGYVNVVLQQLFMVPEFRWAIMSLPENPAENKKESVVWQLQKVFSYLQESELNFHNPKSFCHAFKDYDGQPMDVTAMRDVSEFRHLLLDKLPEELVRQFFENEQVIQYITRDPRCTHLLECTEPLFALSVEIKNHKSLPEALAAYVEGERIDCNWGSFTCQKCEREVAALKRCCFKSLPDMLTIHLRRFEFNLEKMTLDKINDVCAFPMVLDMEPYTREALAKKEGLSLPDEVQRDKAYFQFQLTGFIVHTGKSTCKGRYYAVLRENVAKEAGATQLNWYKFDDTVVQRFDPEQIPAVGERGAYMLFYQRIQLERPVRQLGEGGAAELVPAAILEAIIAENESF